MCRMHCSCGDYWTVVADDEELECAPSKRKTINWTPNAWHHTGFSTSEDNCVSPDLQKGI